MVYRMGRESFSPSTTTGTTEALPSVDMADLFAGGEPQTVVCCKGGPLVLRCRLCQQSPSYWRKTEHGTPSAAVHSTGGTTGGDDGGDDG